MSYRSYDELEDYCCPFPLGHKVDQRKWLCENCDSYYDDSCGGGCGHSRKNCSCRGTAHCGCTSQKHCGCKGRCGRKCDCKCRGGCGGRCSYCTQIVSNFKGPIGSPRDTRSFFNYGVAACPCGIGGCRGRYQRGPSKPRGCLKHELNKCCRAGCGSGCVCRESSRTVKSLGKCCGRGICRM